MRYIDEMTIALFDPFSGISGDMTLGALVDVGLDPEFLEALPGVLGLEGISVRVSTVDRGSLACKKVDFEIPPQPHGRHVPAIQRIVNQAAIPQEVKEQANAAFQLVGEEEARIHGTTVERVHLHEVGSVDAILDIVGSIWGLNKLGVTRVYCGTISLGDGFVNAAHGTLPVPAPATMRILEGLAVRPGPADSGELVTPTGAALVRVLSSGPHPACYVPKRSGYGAGTRDFSGRANALRVTLAEEVGSGGWMSDRVVQLSTDIDDMSAEHLAAAAEAMLAAGALDVVMTATLMKKGRPGTRLEVLVLPSDVARLSALIFSKTTTLGLRRSEVERSVLVRSQAEVSVLGHSVRVKVATLPNGGRRMKAEHADVLVVAGATGTEVAEIATLAVAAAERQ